MREPRPGTSTLWFGNCGIGAVWPPIVSDPTDDETAVGYLPSAVLVATARAARSDIFTFPLPRFTPTIRALIQPLIKSDLMTPACDVDSPFTTAALGMVMLAMSSVFTTPSVPRQVVWYDVGRDVSVPATVALVSYAFPRSRPIRLPPTSALVISTAMVAPVGSNGFCIVERISTADEAALAPLEDFSSTTRFSTT